MLLFRVLLHNKIRILIYIMDLIDRIKTRKIIYNEFGRDVASIVNLYVFGNCNICEKNLKKYLICGGCDNVFCNSCLIHEQEDDYLKKMRRGFDDFCTYCLINMILNDN